jgi:hypothetical protein
MPIVGAGLVVGDGCVVASSSSANDRVAVAPSAAPMPTAAAVFKTARRVIESSCTRTSESPGRGTPECPKYPRDTDIANLAASQ